MTTKPCLNPYHESLNPKLLEKAMELAIGCMSAAEELAALLPRHLTPQQRKAVFELLNKSAAIQKRLEALFARGETRSTR